MQYYSVILQNRGGLFYSNKSALYYWNTLTISSTAIKLKCSTQNYLFKRSCWICSAQNVLLKMLQSNLSRKFWAEHFEENILSRSFLAEHFEQNNWVCIFSAVEYVNAFEQYTGCIERKLTYPLSKNIIRVDLQVKSMPPLIRSMTR